MEENREKGLFQVRSYLGCLNEGFKLATRHILQMLKFTWPSLVGIAVMAGLWGAFFNQFTVAFTQWLAATEPVVLSLPVFSFLILGVLSLLAESFYVGNVMTALSRFAAEGKWPVLKFGALRGEIARSFLRALTFIFIGDLVLGLCLTPCILWLGPASVWNSVAYGILTLVFFVPYCMVGLDYMLGDRHDYFQSLKQMKDGYQNWGSLFIVLFCGGLIMLILAIVSWLPAGVLAYAGHESMMSILAGDTTDLPAAVPYLVVFFFMLASVITSVFCWLTLFPLAYLYGSVEARKKELAAFEAEERRLQKM